MTGKAPKPSIPAFTSTSTSDTNDTDTLPNSATTTQTNPNTNTKGLSCLRCRKKKAKCSKTRPTCTRCARSNQPCEYPDAPPNLTDLSQKVLTLYDTLRQLEGEFLVKYMQSLDDESDSNTNLIDTSSPSITADEQRLVDLSPNDSNMTIAAHFPITTESNTEIIRVNNNSTPVITVSGSTSSQNICITTDQTAEADHVQPHKKQKLAQKPTAAETVQETDEDKNSSTEKHTLQQQQTNTAREMTNPNLMEPAGWSMSLTSQGLSIHAVTRNISEFNDFLKNLTRQLVRDFGLGFLPPNWDPDVEDYYYHLKNEEDGNGDQTMEDYYYSYEYDELDEDEYLVKVPVYSTRSLLFHDDHNRPMPNSIISTLKQYGNGESSRDIVRTLLNGADTLVSIIESHFPHMIKHLDKRFEWLERQVNAEQRQSNDQKKQQSIEPDANAGTDTATTDEKAEKTETQGTANVPHHLLILMQQLRRYLPTHTVDGQSEWSSDPTTKQLTQICILTAYVVSVTLLPRIPKLTCPPLPTSLWRNCAEYATMLLIDMVLSDGETLELTYPIILCAVLLAWIDTDLAMSSEYKADTIVHLALRVLCGSNVLDEWKRQKQHRSARSKNDDERQLQSREAWQTLIASLLYLDVYSATFRFCKPQMKGEGLLELWNVAVQMTTDPDSNSSFRETGIILEAQLMNFLSKVLSLFYEIDEEEREKENTQSITMKEENEEIQEVDDDSKSLLHSEECQTVEGIMKNTKKIKLRKIDVDEVLTLVRDMELWEQGLPDWAKWNNCFSKKAEDCSTADALPPTMTTTATPPALRSMQASTAGLVMHMHMIHNMVKILLFRPFSTVSYHGDNGDGNVEDNDCTEDEEEEQQTLTKTTFLDMSLSSADRLTVCLASIQACYGFTGYWHKAALNLVQDVCNRVLKMFHEDEQVLHEVTIVKQRLRDCCSIKGKKKC